jgi:hypothetical protein
MEQPQTTPSVQSPRIQFREPSFSYAGGPLGVGVDGRTLLPIIFYLKIPIANNTSLTPPMRSSSTTTQPRTGRARRLRRTAGRTVSGDAPPCGTRLSPIHRPSLPSHLRPLQDGRASVHAVAASSACSNTARTRTAAMSCTPATQMTGITRVLLLPLQPPSRTSHHRPRTCRETGVEAS